MLLIAPQAAVHQIVYALILTLTYSSGNRIGAINTPATHESDKASKVLNSLFLVLDSGRKKEQTLS